MQAKFLFLGTGASGGVPLIGCHCAVCSSAFIFNKRMRSAGLLSVGEKKYLIDVGPDFRAQALQHRIDHLDGVLITHAHADHIAGIDDLRAYYFLTAQKLPCLLSQETFQEIQRRFPYLFITGENRSLSAQLDFHFLEKDFGQCDFAGLNLSYLTYFQLEMKVNGFRFGNFAYISDIRTYSEDIFSHLKGSEILVLSALRHQPTQMHFSIEEAIAFSHRVGAKMTYFTHIAHDLDHQNIILPSGFALSYDGLQLSIEL